MRTPALPRTLLLLAGLAGVSLPAQGVMKTPEAWRLSAAWQFTSLDTQVTVGTGNGLAVGTKLDFEDTFDVPVQKQAWAFDASWRFAPRHILDVGYQSFNRVGGRVIEKDIIFGQYEFHAGGRLDATIKSEFPYVGYRYGFYQGGDLELSVGGAITYLTLGAGLGVEGSLVTDIETGTTQVGASVYEEFSVPAPLVVFQIDGRISDHWVMSGYIRPIFIKSSEWKGGMVIWGINASWYLTPKVGFTFGVERTNLMAKDVPAGDLKANFTYNIIGAKVGATVRF